MTENLLGIPYLEWIIGFLVVAYFILVSRGNAYPEHTERERVDARSVASTKQNQVVGEADTTYYQWLRGAGYVISPVALPVGMMAIAAGKAGAALQAQLNLRNEFMDRTWLLAAEAQSTAEGKIFLGKSLSKDGLISVHDAMKWVELESSLRAAHQPACGENTAEGRLLAAYVASKPINRIKSFVSTISLPKRGK